VKATSLKAQSSAKANTDFARVRRTKFKGLEPKIDAIWNNLCESYEDLKHINDDRSIKYIVSRAKYNRHTKLYEIQEDINDSADHLVSIYIFIY
jgi:hypothetical protein